MPAPAKSNVVIGSTFATILALIAAINFAIKPVGPNTKLAWDQLPSFQQDGTILEPSVFTYQFSANAQDTTTAEWVNFENVICTDPTLEIVNDSWVCEASVQQVVDKIPSYPADIYLRSINTFGASEMSMHLRLNQGLIVISELESP